MTAPNFSKFRLGTPVTLPSGDTVSYRELHDAGLPEHYIRRLYKAAARAKVTRDQVDDWLKRAVSQDRRMVQKVKSELEALEPPPPAPAKTAPVGVRRRKPSEKLVTLVSKGNHKQAVKVAESYGLTPVRINPTNLRPGQSAEAHTVQAVSPVAGKLITTGSWATG